MCYGVYQRKSVKGFIRFYSATVGEKLIDEAYRVYVTDSLKYGGENKFLVSRFYDIIHPKPEDHRTAEEIIGSIFKKLGEGEE